MIHPLALAVKKEKKQKVRRRVERPEEDGEEAESSSNNKKRQKTSTIVKSRVSNAYMIQVNAFCKTEREVIGTCLKRLNTEVFQYDFDVGWFRGDNLVGKIEALNTPIVKEALQRFFIRARDMLCRFGFVGLFVVKDIAAWSRRIEESITVDERNDRIANQRMRPTGNSDSDETEEDDDDEDVTSERRRLSRFYETIAKNLPFGVIPLGDTERECRGHYVRLDDRGAMTSTLVFEPDPSWPEAVLFDFRVIDREAEFMPRESTRAGTSELVPMTAFTALARDYCEAQEAQTTTMDFNSMQVYRDQYLVARPLPDDRNENVEDRILYASDSIIGAKQMSAEQHEQWALDKARDQRNRLQMRRRFSSVQAGQAAQSGPPVGQQRVATFGRPVISDFLVELPASMQVQSTPVHTPTYSPDQLRRNYEHNVCSVLGLPYSFFKPFSNQNTGGGHGGKKASEKGGGDGNTTTNAENRDFAQGELNKEVRRQHALFDEIFSYVYRCTFQAMDDQAMATLDFYREVYAGLDFAYVVRKSDAAIHALLPYYHARILSPVILRRFLYQNMGIDEDPEIEPVFPQDELAREAESAKRKRPADDDDDQNKKKKKKKGNDEEGDDGGE